MEMRRTIWAGTSLLVLAACSGSPDAVGENSAGSIKTTAVGEVVANIATPTPTPTADAMTTNDAMDAPGGAEDAAVNAM